MPTVNVPPLVRFVLYLIAAVALLVVAYAVDKEWAGDAEVRLVTGLAGLLYILAAAKTNLSDNGVLLEGTVEQTGAGTADITVHAPGEGQPRPMFGDVHVHGDTTDFKPPRDA